MKFKNRIVGSDIYRSPMLQIHSIMLTGIRSARIKFIWNCTPNNSVSKIETCPENFEKLSIIKYVSTHKLVHVDGLCFVLCGYNTDSIVESGGFYMPAKARAMDTPSMDLSFRRTSFFLEKEIREGSIHTIKLCRQTLNRPVALIYGYRYRKRRIVFYQCRQFW